MANRFIYVLALQQGNYYVGCSDNVERRFQEHLRGQGSAWTTHYPPISIERQYLIASGRNSGLEEDDRVREMMLTHGMDRVRGGSYSNIQLTATQKNELKRTLRHAEATCFHCGSKEHFAVQCNAATQVTNKRSAKRIRNPYHRAPRVVMEKRQSSCQLCGRDGHTADRCDAVQDMAGTVPRTEKSATVRRGSHVTSISYSHRPTGITGELGYDNGGVFIALKLALPLWLTGSKDSSAVVPSQGEDRNRRPQRAQTEASPCLRSDSDNQRAHKRVATRQANGFILQNEQATVVSLANQRPLVNCALCGRADHTADQCDDTCSIDDDDDDSTTDEHLPTTPPLTPEKESLSPPRRYVKCARPNHGTTDTTVHRNTDPRGLACWDFVQSGTCSRGASCTSSHAVQWLGTADTSKHEKKSISSIATWPDKGMKLFTGGVDGRLQQRFKMNMSGTINCLAVAENWFVCGFDRQFSPLESKGMIHVWNLQSTEDPPLELHMLPPTSSYAHESSVTCLCVDSNLRIISGSDDGSIHIWTFDSSPRTFRLYGQIKAHNGRVTALVLQEDFLWSGGIDGSIHVWNVRSGQCQHSISAGITGHSGAITSLVFFESPASRFILSSSLDGTIKAWNALSGECVLSKNLSTPILCLTIGACRKGNPLLLVGQKDGTIECRNLLPSDKLQALDLVFTVPSQGAAVQSITSGPFGTFYSGDDNGKLHTWQISS